MYDCGLRAVWLNMIWVHEAYQKAARKQPEHMGMVRTPLKQKLLLTPLQEVVWSLPIKAHKTLQGATVMMQGRQDAVVPGK